MIKVRKWGIEQTQYEKTEAHRRQDTAAVLPAKGP